MKNDLQSGDAQLEISPLKFPPKKNTYKITYSKNKISAPIAVDLHNGQYFEGDIIISFPVQIIKGTLFYNDGKKYKGSFYQNLKHGVGQLSYPNGDIMNGIWNKGLLDGLCIKLSPGAYSYKIRFLNGVRHGHGIHTDLRHDKTYYKVYSKGKLIKSELIKIDSKLYFYL